MTEKERKLALFCLKANSDYHSEICEECIKYPCSHRIQDDVTETIIKELEQESKAKEKPQPKEEPQPKTGHWFLSGGYWRCSECKEKALLKLDKATGGYREYEPVRSKYCPKCGIKMQEVKK